MNEEGVAIIAGRCNYNHARESSILTGCGGRIGYGAEGRAKRHIDYVKMIRQVVVAIWIHCPVNPLDSQPGAAATAENAYGVKTCSRRAARADAQRAKRRSVIVWSGECGAVGLHA